MNLASFFVTNLARVNALGGARTMSASSMAMRAGGCFVIKASDDVCGQALMDWTLEPNNLTDVVRRGARESSCR